MGKINSLFFKSSKKQFADRSNAATGNSSFTKSISWFAKMTQKDNIGPNEINDLLKKLENFLDEKEFEKAEITAELQLGYAFKSLFEEKLERFTEENSLDFKN